MGRLILELIALQQAARQLTGRALGLERALTGSLLRGPNFSPPHHCIEAIKTKAPPS